MILTGILTLGLLAPTGSSAAVTIGANLALPYGSDFDCNLIVTGCTVSSHPTLAAGLQASGGLVAPANGIVVRWRIKTGASTKPANLHILRPGSSTTRAGISRSSVQTPAPSTTSTFETRLPIKAGDTIGVDSKQPPNSFQVGSLSLYWAPALVDAESASAGTSLSNAVLLVNADIEQDADGDGFGDETQDLCPEFAYTHDKCPRGLDVIKEPGGRVTGPGIDCPDDCLETYPDGTTVDLTAVPDKGYAVSKKTWREIPCTSINGAVCTLVMTANVVGGAFFEDRRVPETTIVKGPKKRSPKRQLRIVLSSSRRAAFECALDTKKFTACTAVFRSRVSVGKHVFLARAVAKHGIKDPTPAKVKFRVLP